VQGVSPTSGVMFFSRCEASLNGGLTKSRWNSRSAPSQYPDEPVPRLPHAFAPCRAGSPCRDRLQCLQAPSFAADGRFSDRIGFHFPTRGRLRLARDLPCFASRLNPSFSAPASYIVFLLMRYPTRLVSNPCAAHPAGHFAAKAIATCISIFALSLPAAEPNPPGGPTVNLNEPVAVTVTNAVEVQGSVEIVNDALKTPFQRGVSASIPAGANEIENIAVPLPPNKRLVIETVTLIVTAPPGQTGWATLGLGAARAYFATQVQGTSNLSTTSIGSHSLTFRLNTNQVSQLNLQLLRSGSTGNATVAVSLFGYTEDL
jgi:hypothetical protein